MFLFDPTFFNVLFALFVSFFLLGSLLSISTFFVFNSDNNLLFWSVFFLLFSLPFYFLLSYEYKDYCENVKNWVYKNWINSPNSITSSCFFLIDWKMHELKELEIWEILEQKKTDIRINNLSEKKYQENKKRLSELKKIESDLKLWE